MLYPSAPYPLGKLLILFAFADSDIPPDTIRKMLNTVLSFLDDPVIESLVRKKLPD